MKSVPLAPSLPAAGRRERRKSATRSELLLAGQKLFGERGLYEARIEDLTARAGIAKGTLYTYFADKDELIRAVAASGFSRLEHHVESRVGDERREVKLLRLAVRAHFEFFEANPDLMRVLHQVRGMLKFDRPAWRPLRVTLNGYLGGLARVLSAAPRIDRLAPEARLELAQLVFGAVSGVASVATASEARPVSMVDSVPFVHSIAAMATAHVSRPGAPPAGAHPARRLRRRVGRHTRG